jgi:ComF family protein
MALELGVCAPCMAVPPDHDGAASAVVYGDVARRMTLRLKHGRRIGLARQIAQAMYRNLPRGDFDLVPVPLHRWRIWSRGFNQSALIGGHLAELSGQRLLDDVLLRHKPTVLLRGLSAAQRKKAVRSAFSVPTAQQERVTGRRLVLIDDVYTSGATANACAKTLKRAGAAEVRILSWARVLLDGEAH